MLQETDKMTNYILEFVLCFKRIGVKYVCNGRVQSLEVIKNA